MSEYLSKKAALEWLKEQQKRQEEKRDRLPVRDFAAPTVEGVET